jgi:hypothetical protein
MERTVREGVNKFLGYKVELRSVSKKGGILLANPPHSSSSTFSCVSFPSFCAFKEGSGLHKIRHF